MEDADLPQLEGPGWVIEIHGYHFHNSDLDPSNWGAQYVRNTLVKQLEEGEVELPIGPPAEGTEKAPTAKFKVQELGIRYPILAVDRPIEWRFKVKNPADETGDDRSGFGGGGEGRRSVTTWPVSVGRRPERQTAKRDRGTGPPDHHRSDLSFYRAVLLAAETGRPATQRATRESGRRTAGRSRRQST